MRLSAHPSLNRFLPVAPELLDLDDVLVRGAVSRVLAAIVVAEAELDCVSGFVHVLMRLFVCAVSHIYAVLTQPSCLRRQ